MQDLFCDVISVTVFETGMI